MATTEEEPTPLQAPVSVVCDALCELNVQDRQRALDAARVILGLSATPAATPVDESAVVELLRDLFRSLTQEQVQGLVILFTMPQRIVFNEIATRVNAWVP